MEDRTKELFAFGETLLAERFEEHLKRVRKEFDSPDSVFLSGLLERCGKLFQAAVKEQEAGEEGEIAYMAFCVLKSYDLLLDPQLKLILYNKDFYLDERPFEITWKPDVIYGHAAESIQLFQKEAGRRFPKLEKGERNRFQLEYCNRYHVITYLLLLQSVEKIRGLDSFWRLKRSESFSILFGELENKTYRIDPMGV